MPNGKIGDHPLNDILIHGRRLYGGGIDEEIEKVAREFGEGGVAKLNALLVSSAFRNAEENIRAQQELLRELLVDLWNDLILERRRRSKQES